MQKKRAATEEEKQQAEIAYQQFYEEALRDPTRYLRHDTDAHDDEALYRLASRHGMAYYGYFWLLAECLAARKGNSYDVSDDAGWRRLAWDLSIIEPMSVDDCKLFVAELAALDLISQEHLSELHLVTSRRIRKDKEEYARTIAQKRLGAWKTNQKRLYG